MRRAILAGLFLAGCGGSGELEGRILGQDVLELGAAWHGGPFILLFDRDVECIESDFASRVYLEGEPISPHEFVAVQIAFGANTEPREGSFGVTGAEALDVQGLVNGSEFKRVRAREGSVTITRADEDRIEGELDVAFRDDGEYAVASFRTRWCRNLEP